jgi:hypothetical protein
MQYTLTENQKELARWIVKAVRKEGMTETFSVEFGRDLFWDRGHSESFRPPSVDQGMLLCLEKHGLLVLSRGFSTVTAKLFVAVDTNFEDEHSDVTFSALSQPHPPEIGISIARLREIYPDPKKLGFLVMRFTAAKPFERIVEIIKATAAKHGITVVRADEKQFHADLWGNVRTYLPGCGFGIAVYERIETEEPNANVGLEVGYLMAMNKPVLLFKDKTVATLQADLAGKLYKPFDPHEPEKTIPEQMTKWLQDNGIVVPLP